MTLNHYCKYAMLSRGRTGSTLLTRMLRDHTGAVEYQELFNVNFEAERQLCSDRARSLRYWLATPADDKLPRRPQLTAIESASEAMILDQWVWHDGYADNIKAVGFKVLHYQWDSDGPFPQLKTCLLERLADIRTVVVTRRNLLRQYLSHVMAHRVQQWHLTDASRCVARPSISFTPAELENAFAHAQLTDGELSTMATAARDHLHFVYEDFTSDLASHWIQLQHFLELPEQPMPPIQLLKIENRPLREAISNYDALKASFRNSGWEDHFDE